MDPPLQRTQVSKQSNNTLEPKSQIQPTRARGRDPQPKSQNATSQPKAARRRTTNEPRIRSVLPSVVPSVPECHGAARARAGASWAPSARAEMQIGVGCGVWGVGTRGAADGERRPRREVPSAGMCGGRCPQRACAEGGALSGHVRREVPSAGTCTATSGARARDHDIIGVTTTTV